MESESDDELIASVAPDVMKCLEGYGFFAKLDDLLSPEDKSVPPRKCDGTYAVSRPILVEIGFSELDLEDIFDVLRSKGGFCDCEILYNVSETNRLKGEYWRRKAEGLISAMGHAPPSRLQ